MAHTDGQGNTRRSEDKLKPVTQNPLKMQDIIIQAVTRVTTDINLMKQLTY